MLKMHVSALAVLAALSFGAQAEVYRILDKNGKVIGYADQPPPDNKTEIQKITDNRVDSEKVPFEIRKAAEIAPVSLYTSPDCKEACAEARSLLSKRKIPFAEQNVTQQQQFDALKKLVGKDGPKVPTLLVGKQPTEGFNESVWNSALDTAGYPKAGK